jgi:hypothetical protein
MSNRGEGIRDVRAFLGHTARSIELYDPLWHSALTPLGRPDGITTEDTEEHRGHGGTPRTRRNTEKVSIVRKITVAFRLAKATKNVISRRERRP